MRKYLYEISRKKLTVGSAAAILAVTSLASNILGLYRERIIASMFGTNHFAEIYGASFRLPDLIFNILIYGALSAAFIPIFIEKLVENKENSAMRLANSFLNLLLIISAAGVIIIAFFAPYLIPLVVPGFKGRIVGGVDMMQTTINATRLLLIAPIFMCISSFFSGILNSHKRFVAYSLAPLIYNISIIVSALFFAEKMAVPVYGLIYGVIIGSVLHAAIQLPAVLSTGFRYQAILDLKDNGIKRILKLMGPRTLTIATNQINLFVDTIMASYFLGGIAVLNYANNIQTLPTVIFGIAIATAAFPYLSEAFSNKKTDDFKKAFSWSLGRILYFIIPAAIGIVVLRAQIVRLVFGIGNFGWDSTQETAYVLGIFGFGLVAQGVLPLLIRTFYVFQDTKTPLNIALISMAVNIVGNLTLPGITVTWEGVTFQLGVGGIALAFALAGYVNAGLSIIYLKKHMKDLYQADTLKDLIKISAAALVMGYAAHKLLYLFDPLVQSSGGLISKGLFPQTLLTIIFSVLLYFVITLILGINESKDILQKIKKNLIQG